MFLGRTFYKDVAPLALRNGRARQSSARRPSADQRRRATRKRGTPYQPPGGFFNATGGDEIG